MATAVEIFGSSSATSSKAAFILAFFFQAEDGIRYLTVTGVQTCALPILTPEAVREIAVRELPGFGEIMRIESMKITKNAILSRNLAVVVDKTLVICLPGKQIGRASCRERV